MFEFFAHLGIGFFVGILLGLIFMFGKSVFEAARSWVAEKKAESVDIASIGVLEAAESTAEFYDTSGSDDLEEREKAWKSINDAINAARQRSRHCVDINHDIYKAIPYKALVKTLRSAGYKTKDIINFRFQEVDYMLGYHLRITWR